MAVLDAAVENLAVVQMRLGLFDNNKADQVRFNPILIRFNPI